MSDDGRRLSEEEARALWRRAADLQAEAARRLEERSRSLAGGDGGEGDAERGEGYAVADVRAAAVEAGISEEFVGQALADLGATGPALASTRTDEIAERFLGAGPGELSASRVYDAPPRETYAALERLFSSGSLGLVLRDTHGGHPLDGGVLVFDVPRPALGQTDGLPYELRAWADIPEVFLSLRPVGGDGRRSEVVLRAPLRHSRRVNTWVGGGLMTGIGLPLSGVATGIAGSVASAAGLAATAVLAVALGTGMVAVGGGVVVGSRLWRRLWRYALGRGERALESILGRLAAHMTTGSAHGTGPTALPALPQAAGEPSDALPD